MTTRRTKMALSVAGILVIVPLLAVWMLRMQREAANVDSGVVEFKKGNFADAARQLAPYAQRGNKAARLTLGIMHAFGNGVPRDRHKAVELLTGASDRTDELYLWIAQSFDKGDGVMKDHDEAVAWYYLASAAGNEDARRVIGP